jgi:hypothetical protein
MDTPVSVLCLKWGSVYEPAYVNHLRKGVSHQLKRAHRFACFANDTRGLRPDVEVRSLAEAGAVCSELGSGNERWHHRIGNVNWRRHAWQG